MLASAADGARTWWRIRALPQTGQPRHRAECLRPGMVAPDTPDVRRDCLQRGVVEREHEVALVLERDRRRTTVGCLNGAQLPEPCGVLHFVELIINPGRHRTAGDRAAPRRPGSRT